MSIDGFGVMARKVGMTQLFDSKGRLCPLTVLVVEPNVVVRFNKEGNTVRLQVGFEELAERKVSKPLLGHYKKSGISPRRFLKEFVFESEKQWQPGQTLSVSDFEEGEKVDVIGITKGKGFQGVIRKHGFAGQPASHGSKTHRRNGAIGERSFPGRVFKNQGMPGHMGRKRVTIQNLDLFKILPEDNALLVTGSIPGARGDVVIVRKAIKGQASNNK
ncbi:50S ribosomal protein L3 [Candidatus Methylacidiphilum fumarolicum]|uniref:Large ribosomal subunit protein uL3 n=3 Tax=Candidatus Methylacidiphilum fumarolicum TaxID=591154 RepID=I0K0E2_METFB|nr:50S ribosomal protein L3 [Candidatus Methylacidiphilum fumarolicum]CCG92961.1 50S ribosomal protein L3 [Methylacidiphilum fumariolicum SolV]MBW6414546.1 50S ribosomal protein L3 [Candidatus Methylacidiphilum fumarolicum]TFE65622.1 50S ribosomal protein L3 [Candidatus Methylacidiphilum fumarolicum]TFE73721.1 50S ribosomal protein L3 [Candidatus Methylacidiphilum fumarolicum]TFE75409.1 50S ribosomal protein L3 [Candidatus Methylacidiphilum fumarolicum]